MVKVAKIQVEKLHFFSVKTTITGKSRFDRRSFYAIFIQPL